MFDFLHLTILNTANKFKHMELSLNKVFQSILLIFIFLICSNTHGQRNNLKYAYRKKSNFELMKYLEKFRAGKIYSDFENVKISDSIKFAFCLIDQFYNHFNFDQSNSTDLDTGWILNDSCNIKNDNYYGYKLMPEIFFVPKLILDKKDVLYENHKINSGIFTGKFLAKKSRKYLFKDSIILAKSKFIDIKNTSALENEINSFLNVKKNNPRTIDLKIAFLRRNLFFFKKNNNIYLDLISIMDLTIDFNSKLVLITYVYDSAVNTALYRINQKRNLEFIYINRTHRIYGQP